MPNLALQLIAENKKTKNPYLDLGNCGLTEVPKELLDCIWLEELILSGSWEFFDEVTKTQVRKISSNKGKTNRIVQLPDDFTSVLQLRKLVISSLSWGTITDLSSLKNLSKLEYLDISHIEITDLLPLRELTHLSSLNISNTGVTNLWPLSKLTNIKYLYVSDTKINDLTPLKGLHNLKHLDISASQVDNLFPLRDMTKLEHIDISWTKVEDLSPLENAATLKQINASYSSVSNIAPLAIFAYLQFIDFTGTNINDLSPLTNCKKLEQIEIASTSIDDLTPLTKLANLEILSLASTNIKDLLPLEKNQKLLKLDVSGTQIRDVSPLKYLSNLQELNIDDTFVSDLSPLVFLLEKGKKNNAGDLISFSFINCPLNIPPPEIVSQGNEAVINYFYELRKRGKEEGLEAKILLIGESQSGKTSLCIRLLDGIKAKLPELEERTRGLKVAVKPLIVKLSKKNQLRLNIFDFGGQTFYKPLHQFFYSQRSLYIMVTRNGDDSNQFEYWFETARLFGGSSPVFVVNNKFGDTPCGFDPSRYPAFKEIIKHSMDVNLKTAEGLPQIRKYIKQLAESLPLVHQTIPKTWSNVKMELENLRYQNIISVDDFLNICAKPENGKMDSDVAFNCLTYLHDIGMCLHYQHIDGLKNYIILEFEWATKAVYRVLEDKNIIDNKGYFTLDDLSRIWQVSQNTDSDTESRQYKKHLFDLLELMKYFKLCYPTHLNGKEFIAPSLLPAAKESKGSVWVPKDDLQFIVEYNNMPIGLFPRFVATNYKKIDSDLKNKFVWRDEVIFKWKNTSALVKYFPYWEGKKAIQFRIQGTNRQERKEMLNVLRNSLLELYNETPGIIFNEKIPCICETCQKKDTPFFFLNSDLELYKEHNKKTITCKYPPLNEVSVDALLGNILPLTSATRKKNHYGEEKTLKVFVSYSKKDLIYLNEFKKFLDPLCRKSYIELWDDSFIKPGEYWNESIKDAIQRADIIFLLVSADLLATNFIWDEEIPEIMRRHKNNEAIVIPIKIRSCDWSRLPINELQGLPRKGGIIAEAKNADTLWTEVAIEIRELIEEFWKE